MSTEDFYQFLPNGGGDCGECTKDWGFWSRNPRSLSPKPPPTPFREEDIPRQYPLVDLVVSGAIAKANEWHPNDAIGDLITGIALESLVIIRACEWGMAGWLPPIAPPDPGDTWLPESNDEKRELANVNRALVGLQGLFAGYTVLSLASQASEPVGRGQVTVGRMFIDYSFDGNADQFAAAILPNFYFSGQVLYWAFREEPNHLVTDAFQALLFENVAQVFQYPLHEIARAEVDARKRFEEGSPLDMGSDQMKGAFMLAGLFSREVGAICERISERTAESG